MDNLNARNETRKSDKRLGKLPAKSGPKALMFADFLRKTVEPPEVYNFWARRKGFPLETYGNTDYGCCTIASQAIGAMRMERLEQRRTVDFPDKSVLDAYFRMTSELYGGGDTGAYETDALSRWRKPDLTFRDAKERPYTIDAFTRVNHFDHAAVRLALFVTQAKGIKVCFNLPWAWSSRTSDLGGVWDLPEGQQPIGEWMPGSWGGHSMWATSRYNKDGLWVAHTWGIPDQFVTWRGALAYMDEVHWVVDSVNAWKKTPAAKLIDLGALTEAVNSVSSQKIV
jgi:hypothetical protein